MAKSINVIVESIRDLNNLYRDPNNATRIKLEALWEMGDCLQKLGVTKPHSIGWKIQSETKGIIKRPTIFRSHKIRQIWKTKKEMINDIGGLKKITFLTEILPLIDPIQGVREKLSADELNQIYIYACKDNTKIFKDYIFSLKKKYSHGSLGQSLDKTKHLHKLEKVVENFKNLRNTLLELFNVLEGAAPEHFKKDIPANETRAFSNMCLSLTTKSNFKLYKNLEPCESRASDKNFRYLYNFFRMVLAKKDDSERARLRRLISAESFAELSDMVSSIQSTEMIKDFKARQRLSIGL
jgi:hypothetical protein